MAWLFFGWGREGGVSFFACSFDICLTERTDGRTEEEVVVQTTRHTTMTYNTYNNNNMTHTTKDQKGASPRVSSIHTYTYTTLDDDRIYHQGASPVTKRGRLK